MRRQKMKDKVIKENRKRRDFPGATAVKAPLLNCRRLGFDPWVQKIPWRRDWLPTPVFLPGEFHGQRSLVGYSPWGCRVSHDWTQNETGKEKEIEQKGREIDKKNKGGMVREEGGRKKGGKADTCLAKSVCSIVSESLRDFYHCATWEVQMAIKWCLIFLFLFLFIS